MKFIIDKLSFTNEEMAILKKSKLDYTIFDGDNVSVKFDGDNVSVNSLLPNIVYVTKRNDSITLKKENIDFMPVIIKITEEDTWNDEEEMIDAKCKTINELLEFKFTTLLGEKLAYCNFKNYQLNNSSYYHYNYPTFQINGDDKPKQVEVYAFGRYFPKGRGKDNINVYSSKILSAKYANVVTKKFYKNFLKTAIELLNIKFDYCWYVPCKENQGNRFEMITDKNGIILIENYKSNKEFGFTERCDNMKNKYSIDNNFEVKDKTILVVDDIITTNATLVTISKLLYDKGAFKVIWFSFAKTISKHIDEYKYKCDKCKNEYKLRFDYEGNPILKCSKCNKHYIYKVNNLELIYKSK